MFLIKRRIVNCIFFTLLYEKVVFIEGLIKIAHPLFYNSLHTFREIFRIAYYSVLVTTTVEQEIKCNSYRSKKMYIFHAVNIIME